MADTKESKNFIEEIVESDLASGSYDEVITRFPPEPNGYLHIGHAKSIVLNFGLAEKYNGRCHLRFDDTNPTTEDPEFVESIKNDVHWLGFDWDEHLYFASDYFEQLYEYAVHLIRQGKAYVDSLSEDEIRAYRGTVTEPGRESPFRSRSVEENLQLFRDMKAGKYSDGEHVLRAKLDMASPNMKLRDPLLYRIKHAHHYRTGDEWCIYPMYDFAHPLSDAIEGISHSLCTLEFENNRPIYDWVVDNTHQPPRPYQYEFARLNLNYSVMSKRKLLRLVEEGHVSGWDDPRLYTIAGLRRRGYTPSAIRSFSQHVGIARANSRSDIGLLEYSIRDDLNQVAPRVMAVLDPLPLEIINYPEGKTEWLDAPYFPHDIGKEGSRKVPFSRHIYIDRADFQEVPEKRFYRLSPGIEVRLRYGYVIECVDVIKNVEGQVTSLKCTFDPATRGGDTPDGRKIKGTIHWVDADQGVAFEARLYDRLFKDEDPESGGRDFIDSLNPKSAEVRTGCFIEPSVLDDPPTTRYQFEREGYFWRDPADSTETRLVFNRIVSLRDSWTKKKSKESASAGTKNVVENTSGGGRQEFDDSAEIIAFADANRITREVARQLFSNEEQLALFQAAKRTSDSVPEGSIANWIVNEMASDNLKVDGSRVAQLVGLVEDGHISNRIAREIQSEVFQSDVDPIEIVRKRGLAQVSDEDELSGYADEVIGQNADKVAAYRSGKTGLMGFFMGQVMKLSGGKANPEMARKVLQDRLDV